MPFPAMVMRVVIVSPSDVGQIRDEVESCIQEWTNLNGFWWKVSLMPIRWETDAAPAVGRPQEVINNQIIDPADVMIAIFRSKVGSPTGKEDSGTIEEIKRGIDQGKEVMIYFSSEDLSDEEVDPDQIEKLAIFKDWCKGKALYSSYESSEHLINQLRHHLYSSVANILKNMGALPLGMTEAATTNHLMGDTGTISATEEIQIETIVADQLSINPPLDTGLVRQDLQMRSCFDLTAPHIERLDESEIHITFGLTNIGRYPGELFTVHVENAGLQRYHWETPHGKKFPRDQGQLFSFHVPRSHVRDRAGEEHWRFDITVDYTDGTGKHTDSYVFYMDGKDPDFKFREDKDLAKLSSICRNQRG
jgi:hypothetical protein